MMRNPLSNYRAKLVDFPGEVMKVSTESLDDNIEEILQFIGE